MTPEEILDKLDRFIVETMPHSSELCFIKEDVIEAMKDYAIIMCEKQREICAENAELWYDESDNCRVDKELIINSPLPEELL